MAAPKKNSNPNKVEVQKVVYKASYECEKCSNQCLAGKKYIARMNTAGNVGHGVVCKGSK